MVKRPTLKVDTTVGASRRVNSECKQDNDEKEEKHPNPSVTSTTSGLLSTPSEPGSPIPTSAQGDMTPLRRRIRKLRGTVVIMPSISQSTIGTVHSHTVFSTISVWLRG
eukprot:701639_1